MICRAPTTRTKSSIPETFLGQASGLALHKEAGHAALWTQNCVNRGSLGSAILLTSSLTLVNEGDTNTVEALWDPGCESSFFSRDLLPFAVNKKDQYFKIETLSPSATKPEIVHGLEAAFQVPTARGEAVTLRLLQHSGLELLEREICEQIQFGESRAMHERPELLEETSGQVEFNSRH